MFYIRQTNHIYLSKTKHKRKRPKNRKYALNQLTNGNTKPQTRALKLSQIRLH